MDKNRRSRLASVIQEEIALNLRHLKDPRIPSLLSIIRVDVTDDGSHATVFVSSTFHEDTTDMDACIEGLKSAHGYLRRALAKALTTRSIPTLSFKIDKGIENTARVHEILKSLKDK